MTHTYLALHLLWPAVAANVVAGSDGSQKTTTWGGVKRAVWSSQSQKRAARLRFEEAAGEAHRTVRTRRHDLAAARLVDHHGWEATEAAEAAASVWGMATGSKEGKGLILARADVLDRLADALADFPGGAAAIIEAAGPAPKKPTGRAGADAIIAHDALAARYKQGRARLDALTATLLDDARAVSIALNGRMMADAPDLNVDGALTVAAAIAVDPWYEDNIDYFTAVDDLARADSSVSAMLGNRERGTSLFYRHAVIDLAALAAATGADAATTESHASMWAQAFALAQPFGNRSSTAPTSYPIFAAATTGPNPANLAPFCARPITGETQYDRAAAALIDHWTTNTHAFGHTAVLHYWTSANVGEGDRTQAHGTFADVLAAALTEGTASA